MFPIKLENIKNMLCFLYFLSLIFALVPVNGFNLDIVQACKTMPSNFGIVYQQ
jgi:hypothetical protein